MEGLSYKEGGGLGYSEKNESAEVMLWRINMSGGGGKPSCSPMRPSPSGTIAEVTLVTSS